MRKNRIGQMLIAALLFAALPACTRNLTVNAADYGLEEGSDNTRALIDALEACRRKGASKLAIPRGVYDIYSDRARQKYLNVSNNDDGMKRIVFLLDGMRDFEIDGGGSLFVCHDHMVPFSVSGCSNVRLGNFSVDWAAPLYLQGEAVAVDAAHNSFDMKILDECNWEIQGDKLRFSNKSGPASNNWHFMAPPMQKDAVWYQDLHWNIWYDPAAKAPAYCDENATRVMEWNFKLDKSSHAEDLGGNTVRLTGACEQLPQKGWTLISVGVLSKNRLSPAIRLSDSRDILVENVTVHYAAGMALIAERCENVTLENYNVLLPENSGRLVTSCADATHFVGCKGSITLRDCVFENMLDDGANVHGVYAEVRELTDPRTLAMSRGHSQQQGFEFARPGEKIALTDRNTLRRYDTLTVASVRNINDYWFEVAFTEHVEGRIRAESVAENLSCQPDVVMTGCTVRRNRARGILISTSGKVLVENNRFLKCTYAGIQTAGDADYWFESGPVTDLTIRNNMFEDQGLAVGNAPVLAIVPGIGDANDPGWHYHGKIVFENNTINAFSRILVQARSVDGFIFRNNIINRSRGYPAADSSGPAFSFDRCRNVTIENNEYNWGPEAVIEASNGCSAVVSRNNKNIEHLDII